MRAKKQWIAALCLTLTGALAADQYPEWVDAHVDDMDAKIRLVRDRAEISRLLGEDLDGEYMLMELELRPLYGSKIEVSRDHFVLRSYRDNDSSQAQSPDRVAGGSALVLGKGETTTVGIQSQSGYGIPVGGVPGTGTRPRRLDGPPSQLGTGTTAQTTASVEAKQDSGSGGLVGRMAELELPMGEMAAPVRGYLYFQLNVKQKLKNLVFTYDGPAGKFKIPFRETVR